MVRGGPRGRGRGGHMKHRPPFIPHVPFDVVLAEPAFPPMKPPKEGEGIYFFNLTYDIFWLFKTHLKAKVLINYFFPSRCSKSFPRCLGQEKRSPNTQ